ncbi:DNA mismatch repair protein MutS2 [Hathewaya proteolytica DSM 3090]|uniref:Endonuclease MutS2 n=1 Tax=Hathewaya proteolytica DSM 3090 TaxID=1121331 RepID=A0A1M6QSS6_9CLOT|nr:endonuclease MutS2 [Hathewaya proteolytica]SHK23205.1 DNA mismatch repair protein MutS2 [Hathewaya proteolytica DSM 3090]
MNEKGLRVLEFNKIKEIIRKNASTGAGKELIDNLKPYDNIHDVKEHIEETDEAVNLINKKGMPPMEGLYDVREDIDRAAKGGTLRGEALLKIANVLRCARRFTEYVAVKEGEDPYKVLSDIVCGIIPLKRIEDKIFDAIISEDEVSDRASEKLYSIRRALKDKNANVKQKVGSMVRSYGQYLQENLYTMRGDRYVIPVKSECKGQVPGLVHDQSASGATLFIEPMGLVDLNNEIKELMLKEKAEVDRILAALTKEIFTNIKTVENDANIVWELDFIFAKAKYAYSTECTKPMVSEEGIIDVVKGRHPLIDPSVVVRNDIYLGKDFTSLIITGPNTGGKTVTIKTLGLIELMALSGLLIPADENSVIGFFKEVFADIGDEQSIEQSLSTFSSHMTNIVEIMDKAEEDSLVLFDELGAGTDPTEGAALAVAILEELRKRKCKILATTHYSEIKAYALKTMNVENACVEFDVNTLRPTYKLLIGVPGKSNAFEISRKLGLPGYIIDFAKKNISHDNMEFEDLISSLQEKNILAEQYARKNELLKDEARKLKEKYEEKLEKVENIREKAIQDAKEEARKIVRNAKSDVDEILKEVRKLESSQDFSEARKKLESQREKVKGKLSNLEDETLYEEEIGNVSEALPGQEYTLIRINEKVTVITEPDKKGDLLVQAGIMKIKVNLSELKTLTKDEIKRDKKIQRREAKLRSSSVSSSVDLRGMDSEEALYSADKYLDEVYLAGLKEVTLIHGKGTGILRKSIQNMLKTHPHVKSSRLGEYGEGGIGVTVVTLK